MTNNEEQELVADLVAALRAAFASIVGVGTAHRMANNGWQWPDDAPERVSIVAEKIREALAKAERLSVIEGG